ncbi:MULTISPECIES: RNA-binding protein [Pseudoalteromonas]|uniref:RNA-binding protein n=1 Tax=Pseudoalteromonas haloplanktis TaxID=228 RepID=A0ABU1BKB6_PSEHA|nr:MULTISPECIES: RNA-binding protein [Pseudoalteromonas]MDQ9093959.1 RNA-binding protein [Pseudoalteromonas haloplanktis]
MTSNMVRAIILSIAFITIPAFSAVYQCTIDGVVTFSQLPCGEDAKEITIPATNVAQSTGAKQGKTIDEDIDSYLATQKIDRNIALIQREIKQLQDTLAAQKTKINYMTQDTANRMGASSIADAIAQRTAQVEQRIKPQIEQYQQQLEALNTLKIQLNQ